jgi:hypothetical protein
MQDQQITSEMGITPEKAARWRNRYLDGGIGEFIDKHNQSPKPFIWTAKAFDILRKGQACPPNAR